MSTKTTHDVKISVSVFYQEQASMPDAAHYVYAYRVRIDNNSESTIRILKRFWHIIDSDGSRREIQGEGVVGEKPIIEPGQHFIYTSGCDLLTDMGKMSGSLLIERQYNGQKFTAQIPEFPLVAPYRNN